MRYDIGILLTAIAASRVAKAVVIAFVICLTFTVAIAITQNVYNWVGGAPPLGVASIDVGKLGTVIGLVGVPAFMVTIYIADQSRPRFPSLTMDLQVTRVPASQSYDAVVVTLNATNTGTGRCYVTSVRWRLKVLSPYDDDSVVEMQRDFDSTPNNELDVEFPWHEVPDVPDMHTIEDVTVEPNETEQMTHDFIIPAEIRGIVVSAWVANASESEHVEGWYRRAVHTIEET